MDPLTSDLSCHINNIPKLPTRGCLEEWGLRRLPGPKLWARLFPEEAGFLPSLEDEGRQLYLNTDGCNGKGRHMPQEPLP